MTLLSTISPGISTVDLHMHSSCSDGSDSVSELLEAVKQNGITTFALTDHDTIDGCAAMQQLVPDNIRFIPGIEFSCVSESGKCHILGYRCNFQHPAFQAALNEGKRLRQEKLKVRLNYLKETYHISFTKEELNYISSLKSVGKPHLARLIMKYGFGSTIDEAIQKYINGCNTPNDRIKASTAIQAILASGGIPVWAHPLGGEGEKRLTREQFEKQLLTLKETGIQGLECCYSRYNQLEQDFLLEQAEKYQLYVSGGSDYHGTNKNIPLGTLHAEGKTIPQTQLTLLNYL